jgi:RNase P/RNase MRP subunit p29
LLEYEIDFGSFDNISVEFSDVTKIKNGVTDVKSVFEQASSMATSYSSVQRQAKQGEKSNNTLNNWVEKGLNTTQAKIVDSVDENLLFGKNGFWCREYDPITQTYSYEQIKIINSTIAITDDNWNTTKTAIGKIYYVDPHTDELKTAYGVNGETIVGKLLIGEQLDISNENGNLQFGADGFVVKNDVNTISMNPNSESIFNISNDSKNIFSLNEDGELVIVGNITASSLTLLDGTTIETENITGLSNVAISGDYKDIANTPTKLSDFENDGVFITKDVNNLTNYYKKSETDSLLNSKADTSSLATIATSGSYNDLKDINELKNWVLTQIQNALNS